jgi:hypothetical protein
VGLEEVRLKDYNNQDSIQFVNKERDASYRDKDLNYISSKDEAEVKDNIEDTRFTIDSITFNRANGN